MAPVTWKTIALETAIRAVRAYNSGCYNGLNNPALDLRGQQVFAHGLAQTLDGVCEQVRFIGHDYGGVAGFKAALSLAPVIAQDIYADLNTYWRIAEAAPALNQAPSSVKTIEILLKPFDKPLHGKRIWLTWASKFWHFLNHDAFLIEDSRVNQFFGLGGNPNSPRKYVELLNRFRRFEVAHQAWIEPLRAADNGLAWSDNKLWDKVFYGVVELGDDVGTS